MLNFIVFSIFLCLLPYMVNPQHFARSPTDTGIRIRNSELIWKCAFKSPITFVEVVRLGGGLRSLSAV